MEAVRGVVAAATNAVTTSDNNVEQRVEPSAQTPVAPPPAVDTISLSTVQDTTTPEAKAVTNEATQKSEAAKAEVAKSISSEFLSVTDTVIEFATQGEGGEKRILSFRVVDRETGRILREFPPDKLPTLLSEAHSGLDFSAGRMLNKKA